MSRDEVVPSGVIVEALWPRDPPSDPAANIQVYASRIRKRLGADSLLAQSSGYRVPRNEVAVDVDDFEELVKNAAHALRNGRPEYAAKLARESLALWRGEPYADVRYETFAQAEIGRLVELRTSVQEYRIEADLALGLGRDLIPELEALTAEHEGRERVRGHLMLALYQAGRQADALSVFRATSAYLGRSLGIEPSPWLQDLEEKILLQDPSLTATNAAAVPHNLPEALTRFFGRSDLVNDIGSLIRATRAVTLIGLGGIGKSRLAIQVAREAVNRYDDGAWLVEVPTGATVEQIAQVALDRVDLDASEVGEPLEDLVLLLRARRALLILDGCEQALESSATLATALLRTCAGLTVMATSREALGISGERTVEIGPMVISPEGSPAEQLFTDRARIAGVVDMPADWGSRVRYVCHRLDGIPLAIELVAGRLRTMTLHQVEARIDNVVRLVDRGARDAAARHQTLGAAIEWSYEVLNEGERLVWTRLSVFPASFTLDAAEHVAGFKPVDTFDVVNSLASVVDKSMLRIVRDDAGGISYHMLGVLRSYASNHVGEAEAYESSRRMVEFYLQLLAQLETRLMDPDDSHVVAWISDELENLRASLRWSLAHGTTGDATQLAGALSLQWLRTGSWASGRSWLSRSLAASTGPGTATLASALVLHQSIHGPVDALVGLAELANQAGATDRASRLLGAAAELARVQDQPPPELARIAGPLRDALGDQYELRVAEGVRLVSR